MAAAPVRTFQLNSLSELELHNVEAELVTYRGRHAVRARRARDEPFTCNGHPVCSDFRSGVIEAGIAGLREKTPPGHAWLCRHGLFACNHTVRASSAFS